MPIVEPKMGTKHIITDSFYLSTHGQDGIVRCLERLQKEGSGRA
jgi:hypothetical protein